METNIIRRSRRLHNCFRKNVLTQKSYNAKARMGTKTTFNKEKPSQKCSLCDLKFQTRQALRAHKSEAHKTSPTLEDKPDSEQKAKTKNTPAGSTPRVSKRLQMKKSSAKDSDESDDSDIQNTEEKVNKTEFLCPRCDKIFPIFFQAIKHIQKKHCEDGDGNPVSPDSPDIVKPVTIETCPNCNKHVSTLHNCNSSSDATLDKCYSSLFCLACEEQFSSIALFNKHSSNKHNVSVDSMFFKTVEEFNMWKQIMESQVKIKYVALNKSSTQTYYQCNYVSPKNNFDKTYLCPSLLFAKDFNAGIQIHYSKEHYGHTTPKYEVPQKFSQYLSNKKEPKTGFDLLITKDDEDLYVKFKDLLKNISSYAAKLNLSQIRKLFEVALKMQGLLNSFDEDQGDNTSLISKVMSDDQITDVLEDKRSSARLKRKSETRASVDVKKKKIDIDSDNNMNSKSKNDENSSKTKENKEFESPNTSARSSPDIFSPSFNDTYKQFISRDNSKKTSKNTKSKEIVKTKMGQFSPKKKTPNDEMFEDLILRKPNILKPSITNTSFIKDIKYEVREQENDCNILILKI